MKESTSKISKLEVVSIGLALIMSLTCVAWKSGMGRVFAKPLPAPTPIAKSKSSYCCYGNLDAEASLVPDNFDGKNMQAKAYIKGFCTNNDGVQGCAYETWVKIYFAPPSGSPISTIYDGTYDSNYYCGASDSDWVNVYSKTSATATAGTYSLYVLTWSVNCDDGTTLDFLEVDSASIVVTNP